MAKISTSNLNEQNQILSNIDSFLACLEKFPDNECPNQSISVNPFEFLLELLFRLGKQDKLLDFLTKILKKEIPLIEVTVKGILLSNLKKMTDCTLDPRIPDFARNEGITLDLGLIDMYETLNESPLDKKYNQLYMECDTENATSPFSFLRGKDFNTFLWYIIHKGKYPNPSVLYDFENDFKSFFDSNKISGNSINELVILDNDNIIEGNSFKQHVENGYANGISVATTKNIHTELFPIGEESDRTTYYVNRQSYFDFIKGEDNRNFNEDIPLCSLKYIGEVDNNAYNYYGKQINFKILEKPFVHIMNGATFILFDAQGNPNKHGKYTVRRKKDTTMKIKDGLWYYSIEGQDEKEYYLVINGNNYFIATKNNDEFIEVESNLPFIHECYPNLTVYEFNYDFVMSMRLFDAKVIAAQLINTLCHTSLGNITLSLSSNFYNISDRLTNIVKKILEADDSDSSDCYFSFSNEEIEERLHKSDLKRSNLVPFGETTNQTSNNYENITNLLNAFAEEATLEGSSKILSRLINEVETTITNENYDEATKYSVQFGILSSLTLNLTTILVNSILSPKVITAFMLNYELFGGKTNSLTPEELIESMIAPIKSLVKEIKDLLIRELYNYLLVFLKELCVLIQQKVLLEQVNNYRKIIKKMLEECIFSFGKGQRLNTTIDNVDYADIDDTEINQIEPKC